MWILPAGTWSCFVNGAVVVGPQKRARSYIEHVVAVFIKMKVLFYQRCGADAQVSGQPLNIDVAKNRTGRFATVGTDQTVNFLKDFIGQVMELLIEVPRTAGLQLAKEKFIGLVTLLSAPDGLGDVHDSWLERG